MTRAVSFVAASLAGAGLAGDFSNIALGRPYTLSRPAKYKYCSDSGDDVQLTDGIHSTGKFWMQKETVGWDRTGPYGGAQMITVDLGRVAPISGFAYTLAAGAASVAWPSAIGIYVSDDRKEWTFAGDLWARSVARTGAPKPDEYSVYRAFDGSMPCRGRYVAFLHCAQGFGFCDEVEVFAGAEDVENPHDAHMVANPLSDILRLQVLGFVASDARRMGVPAPDMDVPNVPAAEFRTELPFSKAHADVWAKNAARLRSAGIKRPMFWKNGRWDNLDPLSIPPKESTATRTIEVEMMRGETRSETVNIVNPTDRPIDFTLTVRGLPDSANCDCREVLFTAGAGVDNLAYGTCASALKPGNGTSVLFTIPAGASKQAWISFAKPGGAAGTFKGSICASGGGVELAWPLVLTLHDLDFPSRPRIHVGGWDYTDDGAKYNGRQQAVVADKREMLAMHTDTAWGSHAVFPKNARFDAEGNLSNRLDFAILDDWLKSWPAARRFGAFYRADDGQDFYGEAEGSPRFRRMVGTYFKAWYERVVKMGDGRDMMVDILDEPHTPEQSRTVVLWSEAIHAFVPGLKVFVDPSYKDVSKLPPELLAAADVLCPSRSLFSKDGRQAAWTALLAQKPAMELFLYTCWEESRSLDPVFYYREQFWDAFRMGATGSFFWQFGNGGGPAGSLAVFGQNRKECSPYFAGATVEDVMPGKQSEAIREGAEDYELLSMMRDAAKPLKAKGGEAAEIAEKVERFLADAPTRAMGEWKSPMWAVARQRDSFDKVRIRALRILSKVMRDIRDERTGSLALSICDFGAAPGDGTNTLAIQSAINACEAFGGGLVTIPTGRFLTGGITLRSNVELHLEPGAVLEGVAGSENYPDVRLDWSEMTYRRGFRGRVDSEGCESIPWRALVSASGATNVAVTGKGEIYGNGWNFPFMSYGDRPLGLLFNRCRGVRVEGVSIRDPARWSCYFKECDKVVARRVRIDSHSNCNNDGFDVESRNVLIEDCDIDAGDDAIVLKSDNPGFCVENVEVRNCRLASNCNHFKIGTASHGVFRHIRVTGCKTRLCSRPTLWRGETSKENLARIREKWPGCPSDLTAMSGIAIQNVDGGLLEDVEIKDMEIEGSRVPIAIRMGARRNRSCGIPFGKAGLMRGIRIKDVKATALTPISCSITGVPGFRPSDILLENVSIVLPGGGSATAEQIPVPECEEDYPEANMFGFRHLPARGFYIRHSDGVVFRNVGFRTLSPDDRPEIVAEDSGFTRE